MIGLAIRRGIYLGIESSGFKLGILNAVSTSLKIATTRQFCIRMPDASNQSKSESDLEFVQSNGLQLLSSATPCQSKWSHCQVCFLKHKNREYFSFLVSYFKKKWLNTNKVNFSTNELEHVFTQPLAKCRL